MRSAWIRSRASSNGFNFHLGLKRLLQRLMIMEDDVKSLPRESQGEDFSQSMCRAGDKGKR